VLLIADVGTKRCCLALLVVAVQLVGAVSHSIFEVYNGQPVHITIMFYVCLYRSVAPLCFACTGVSHLCVLINSAVYALATVAETHPSIDFLEILLAVSGKMVLCSFGASMHTINFFGPGLSASFRQLQTPPKHPVFSRKTIQARPIPCLPPQVWHKAVLSMLKLSHCFKTSVQFRRVQPMLKLSTANSTSDRSDRTVSDRSYCSSSINIRQVLLYTQFLHQVVSD